MARGANLACIRLPGTDRSLPADCVSASNVAGGAAAVPFPSPFDISPAETVHARKAIDRKLSDWQRVHGGEFGWKTADIVQSATLATASDSGMHPGCSRGRASSFDERSQFCGSAISGGIRTIPGFRCSISYVIWPRLHALPRGRRSNSARRNRPESFLGSLVSQVERCSKSVRRVRRLSTNRLAFSVVPTYINTPVSRRNSEASFPRIDYFTGGGEPECPVSLSVKATLSEVLPQKIQKAVRKGWHHQ